MEGLFMLLDSTELWSNVAEELALQTDNNYTYTNLYSGMVESNPLGSFDPFPVEGPDLIQYDFFGTRTTGVWVFNFPFTYERNDDGMWEKTYPTTEFTDSLQRINQNVEAQAWTDYKLYIFSESYLQNQAIGTRYFDYMEDAKAEAFALSQIYDWIIYVDLATEPTIDTIVERIKSGF